MDDATKLKALEKAVEDANKCRMRLCKAFAAAESEIIALQGILCRVEIEEMIEAEADQ